LAAGLASDLVSDFDSPFDSDFDSDEDSLFSAAPPELVPPGDDALEEPFA
jgi:hypothetical protein